MSTWAEKWDTQKVDSPEDIALFERVAFMSKHHVTIKLNYTENGTPYKWHGRCICGWNVLSWQWVREEGGGGSMVHALCHVGLCGDFAHVRERVIEVLGFYPPDRDHIQFQGRLSELKIEGCEIGNV